MQKMNLALIIDCYTTLTESKIKHMIQTAIDEMKNERGNVPYEAIGTLSHILNKRLKGVAQDIRVFMRIG